MKISNDVIYAIVGILEAIFFFLLGLTAKKPKLVAGGTGSGIIKVPGKDVVASSATIENNPTFLGLRIPRETANIESARIYDPELGEPVGHTLKWEIEGTRELSDKISIKPGKSARVYLFAKERHSEEYFIFNSTSLRSEPGSSFDKYNDKKKDFKLEIHDEIGRRYRFDFSARNYDQSVNLNFKLTLPHRFEIIREGFRMLGRGFSPKR